MCVVLVSFFLSLPIKNINFVKDQSNDHSCINVSIVSAEKNCGVHFPSESNIKFNSVLAGIVDFWLKKTIESTKYMGGHSRQIP